VGLTLYKLDILMEGEALDQVLDPVHTFFQAEALKQAGG